jgi:D-aminoacyl-tRNA deacylase
LILLAHSSLDVAGVNIAKKALDLYDFTKTAETYQDSPVYNLEINGRNVTYVTLKEESVNAQYLQDDFPNAELIVFLSRHSSQSARPTLTVHTPGNFANAELGGLSRYVSVAPAVAMQTALKAMVHYQEQYGLRNFEISYEVTHHGPSLRIPTMFVELGSSPPQWADSIAAEAVAHSAMTAIANFEAPTPSCSAVLGIGGTHYNQQFTLMALMGAASFGHMIPKYAVPHIDAEMITQCVEKTLERVPYALLDWKGIKSEDKPGLLSALETAGLPYKKI